MAYLALLPFLADELVPSMLVDDDGVEGGTPKSTVEKLGRVGGPGGGWKGKRRPLKDIREDLLLTGAPPDVDPEDSPKVEEGCTDSTGKSSTLN